MVVRNNIYTDSAGILDKPLFISLLALMVLITFFYILNVGSTKEYTNKTSNLLHSPEHAIYVLETNSNTSSENKRYFNKLLTPSVLNNIVNKTKYIYYSLLSKFSSYENISFLSSLLRSPPSLYLY